MRRRARAATWKAAATSGLSVFFGLLLLPASGAFFYGSDTTRIDASLLCAIRERFERGERLWLSPLLENGGPLIARFEAQLLYPPRWVALALPVEWGVAWNMAFHLALGAAMVTWLCRTFGMRPRTAVAMGVAFACCGTSLDLIRHAYYVCAAAWLPCVWAAGRRSLGPRRTVGTLAALGVGLLACLLSGEAHAFVVAVALVVFESLRLWFARPRARKRLLRVAAIGASASAIAMGQWLLTVGELGLTRRAGNLVTSEALQWSLSPPLWLGLVLPGMPLEVVQPSTTLWQIWNQSLEAQNPWNAGPYLGALLVTAVLCGLLRRRARPAAIVFGTAFVFALGSYAGLLPLLIRLVPAFARFRYPSKYMLIASIAAVVVAGLFFDGLRRDARQRRLFTAALGTMAAVLIGGWVWVTVGSEAINASAAAMRLHGPRPDQPDLPLLADALRAAAVHACVPVLIAAVLLTQVRLRAWVSAIVAVDLLAAGPFIVLAGQPLLHLKSPLATLHQPDVRQPAVLCVLPSVGTRFFDLRERLEWDQTLAMRQHLLPELQACDGLASGLAYSALESSMSGLLNPAVRQGQPWALRAMGCSHVVLDQRAPAPGAGTARALPIDVPQVPALAERGFRVRLLELADPLPMVFVAPAPVLAASEAAALDALGRAASSAEQTNVVDDPLRRLPPDAVLPAATGLEATVAWAQADAATVTLTGAGKAVVGVRTAFLVGWRAQQAGAELPVVRATGNHVAVLADAALGPITLTYVPPLLGWAIAAALIGTAGAAFTLLRARRP